MPLSPITLTYAILLEFDERVVILGVFTDKMLMKNVYKMPNWLGHCYSCAPNSMRLFFQDYVMLHQANNI